MQRLMWKQRLFRIFFWTLLVYTAISTTIVCGFQFGLIKGKPYLGTGHRENIASESTFIKQFVREYFFWIQGKEENRAQRLKPFLASGLDAQSGIDFTGSEWNSFARHVDVWSITERESDPTIKEVKVFVETILANSKDETNQKRVDRFLVVPIVAAGQSYRVVENPYLTTLPKANDVKINTKPIEDYSKVEDKAEINKFLNSFWKTYTTGDPQEIGYFYEENKPLIGLKGLVSFVELKDVTVYKNNAEYLARGNVVLEDDASKVKFTQKYTFKLIQAEKRWLILKLSQGDD